MGSGDRGGVAGQLGALAKRSADQVGGGIQLVAVAAGNHQRDPVGLGVLHQCQGARLRVGGRVHRFQLSRTTQEDIDPRAGTATAANLDDGGEIAR